MAAKLVLDRFLPYRLSVASNVVSTRISNAYRKRFGLKITELPCDNYDERLRVN